MTTYPSVLDESSTLNLVLGGHSLARYGDGEFALAENRSIRPQRCRPELASRLRGILLGDVGACLVGIPNILSKTPKAPFWEKYKRCAAMLSSQVSYVSSFVTRPDNAPWLDEPSYWQRLEALWKGHDVTLVRGDDPNGTGAVSLLASDLTTAASVTEVIAPGVNAWYDYEAILERIGRPAHALICLGATATVLAVDLSLRGVHAVDLGHVGMFLRQYRRGEPIRRVKGQKVAS